MTRTYKTRCTGGIERAFSSFTLDKAQAQAYASKNMLFEAKMGLVDRGADISWLSQYPREREVLYPPLTAYEVIGMPYIENGAGRPSVHGGGARCVTARSC